MGLLGKAVDAIAPGLGDLIVNTASKWPSLQERLNWESDHQVSRKGTVKKLVKYDYVKLAALPDAEFYQVLENMKGVYKRLLIEAREKFLSSPPGARAKSEEVQPEKGTITGSDQYPVVTGVPWNPSLDTPFNPQLEVEEEPVTITETQGDPPPLPGYSAGRESARNFSDIAKQWIKNNEPYRGRFRGVKPAHEVYSDFVNPYLDQWIGSSRTVAWPTVHKRRKSEKEQEREEEYHFHKEQINQKNFAYRYD